MNKQKENLMKTMIFVNLPVKDLQRSIAFFTSLGYTVNEQFTNEDGACLVVSDTICFMLLREPFFNTFTPKKIADTSTTVEVINAIMVDSRQGVDELVDKAFAAGAGKYREPEEYPFMYSRSFQDPDGHLWEVGFMDSGYVQKTD
jgi:uncharacterized protein